MSCKVKLSSGRSFDFTPRLVEIQTFLKQEDTLRDLYAFIGESDKIDQNLKSAKTELADCKVVCSSQRGSSYYRSGGIFGGNSQIVLRLGWGYTKYTGFAHLVLHEYTHALVPCTPARMSGEERTYYSRFRGGQSGYHCTSFKKALLRLDLKFGLLTESQFGEILKLLDSKMWKRPYEFERKYTSQLAVELSTIQTRGLTAKQLETTVKSSVKQMLNKCLTTAIMREGSAPRDLGGYSEACFTVKTTWKDSDVGHCVALFAKDVVLREWRVDEDLSNGRQAGWESPFRVHVFSGVTEDLEYKVLQANRKGRYDSNLRETVYDPPLSRRDQSVAVKGILSTAQSIYDHLEALGVLGRGLNVALVTDQEDDPSYEDIKVALVFDPSLESTIFKSLSDGHIDSVAYITLLYNVLTSGNLDYRSLSPSDFATIDSVVWAFIRSFPVPLELGDWIPWQIDDCPPYGAKYALEGILGQKYKPSKLFWRGYLSDRIIAGNPVSLPGFFTQFSYNDQNYECGADGENTPIEYLDGGYSFYRRCTGDVHPKFGLVDSGVGVYVEAMDIDVGSDVRDFVADLAEHLGVADTFDGMAVSFDRGLYAEVLCALKANSDKVRAREGMRRFARGEIESAPQDLLSTFSIPYSLSEVQNFAEDMYTSSDTIMVYDLEFSVSSDFLEKMISSRCPTIRLLKSVYTEDLCVLVSDGQRVSTLKTTRQDLVAGDVLLEMLTGTSEMSEYGYLDLGPKPRENFRRTSARGLAEASSDVSALLDLPIMTFTGSGEINLLDIDPDRFSDPFEILSNLDVVPSVSLRTLLPAIEGSALIAVLAEDNEVRYYYSHLGDAFEVTSIVAWWLVYL